MDNNFWAGRRVFVTGCAGFLGSWLTAALVANGAQVIGLLRDHVRDSQLRRSGTLSRISTVTGSPVDYNLMERILAEYEVEMVFHLAALTLVGVANKNPMATFETNIRGTWLLLEAARRSPTVQGVVVASTDKAYGDLTDIPYREDYPLQGRFPYDVSKSCADLIAQSYATTYRLPVAITRCSNLYGGGDLNWSRILPGTIRSVLRGQPPEIRSNGQFKRDYLYVQDGVRGYLMLAEQLTTPTIWGESFNFGMGQPTSALDVVKTIIKVSDYPNLEPVILNEVKHEIKDQYLLADKAKARLGWQPQHTLESGLAETIDWYRTYLSQHLN